MLSVFRFFRIIFIVSGIDIEAIIVILVIGVHDLPEFIAEARRRSSLTSYCQVFLRLSKSK